MRIRNPPKCIMSISIIMSLIMTLLVFQCVLYHSPHYKTPRPHQGLVLGFTFGPSHGEALVKPWWLKPWPKASPKATRAPWVTCHMEAVRDA